MNNQIKLKLFQSLKKNFFKKIVIITFFLLLFLIIIGYILIILRFKYKLELNKQKKIIITNIYLNKEWAQIVQKYSYLTTLISIDSFAQKENMKLPQIKNINFLYN